MSSGVTNDVFNYAHQNYSFDLFLIVTWKNVKPSLLSAQVYFFYVTETGLIFVFAFLKES